MMKHKVMVKTSITDLLKRFQVTLSTFNEHDYMDYVITCHAYSHAH